jgi:energy-coupling factor transport system permease protein
MKGFLNYIKGDSVFHKMNPVTKLVFSFAICAACFISDSFYILGSLILLNILIGMISGIAERTFILLKGLVKISLFLVVLQILLIQTGKIYYQFSFGLKITEDGVMNASRLVLRLMGATLPLALMLSVTKLADLSNALVEKVHVPYKYAFTLTTAIRFIPVFTEELAGIMEAQTSRGVELDTRNPFKKIALILPLCAPLLVSSVRKTETTAIAADLRGFKFRKRGSCVKEYPYKAKDVLCFIFSIILIAGSIYCKIKFKKF